MHEVALLPGSDPSIFALTQWLPIVHNQQSHELWVDFWWPDTKALKRYIKSHRVKKLVFYDIFHANPAPELSRLEIVRHYQRLMPTVLLTACKTHVLGIDNVLHFDFYWNRAKSAYLDKALIWKQSLPPENYNQWPIQIDRRPSAILSLYGKNNWAVKQELYHAVKHISGYHGGHGGHGGPGTVLSSETGITDLPRLTATPPAKKYFDNTYISAQVESLCLGPTVLYSEKTYDHLIQGRFVLNFGPRHFYRNLVNDGWRLPVGVNYSWDDMEDQDDSHTVSHTVTTQPRFQAYVKCLLDLASDMERLHELFVANYDVFAHNHARLWQKPYDIISLEQLAHK
jgi:hypothetical protein